MPNPYIKPPIDKSLVQNHDDAADWQNIWLRILLRFSPYKENSLIKYIEESQSTRSWIE